MVTKINWYHEKEIIEWCWASESELITTPYWTSCYLIDGLLIDSGAPGGVKDFREFIMSEGPQKIKTCVLTHSHEDHAGGAHLLQKEFGITIFASQKALPILKKGYTYPQYRQIAWGSELLPVEAEPIPKSITSDSTRYSFDVLPIPGHAPDQVALIEKKQQWAFVTDGVQPKYKRIFGGTCSIQENISEIYQSIQDLYIFTEGMDNLQLFLSGKGVVLGRTFLEEKMKAIEVFHQSAHEFFNQGLNEDEIVQKMFEGEDFVGMMTEGELSRKNLIISLLDWPMK